MDRLRRTRLLLSQASEELTRASQIVSAAERACARAAAPRHGRIFAAVSERAVLHVAAGEMRARAARECVEAADVASGRPAPSVFHELTAREHDVLEALVEGATNGQIAERLCISPKTAGVHVSHILAKLHAPNRTAAATLAHRSGMVGERSADGAPGHAVA